MSALLIGSGGLSAQAGHIEIEQTAINTDAVTNNIGNDIVVGGEISGTAGSATVTSTGAQASVGVLGINTDFIAPANIGDIDQTARNSGEITTKDSTITIGGELSGTGAVAAVAATGSRAAVAITGINYDFTDQEVGDISQRSENKGKVVNNGEIVGRNITGDGAAMSISATGASSAVSVNFIDVDAGAGPETEIEDVTQFTKNGPRAPISNEGTITINAREHAGVTGDGASVSIGASGASSVVTASFIDVDARSGPETEIGDVTQFTKNSSGAGITNEGSISINARGDTGVTGDGASASIGASGAASAVAASFIDIDARSGPVTEIGDISQITINDFNVPVHNDGTILLRAGRGGDAGVFGDGASVSVSAVGASSAVAFNFIDVDARSGPVTVIDDVTQTTTNSRDAAVSNNGTITLDPGPGGDAGVFGDGASISISAVGAASAVAVSFIDVETGAGPFTEIDNITQVTTNGARSQVNNFGTIDIRPGFGGDAGVFGDGASISISAVGASSAVAVSFIDLESRSDTSIGNVNQATENASAVINYGSITGTPIILSGDGAYVGISAVGASSAVSTSFINSTEHASVDIGNIDQATINSGDVTNNQVMPGTPTPGTLELAKISGDGASASISATGAVSAVSITSIRNENVRGRPSTSLGRINQVSVNSGAITNNGGVINNRGSISGNLASASISATGAASSISVASINGRQPLGRISVGRITQSSTNSGAVTNTGRINTGTIRGTAASASISAVGASSSVSFTAIR